MEAPPTIIIEKNQMVTMRDGVELACDVYRPNTEEPVAALLQRTPYGKDISSFHNFTLEVLSIVGAGYAVVVQDSRGRFASGGDFEPYVDETFDGADTIDWIAAQEWASGRIGMFGASYYGVTQWQAASVSPLIGAIAPVVSPDELYGGLLYQGGAFQLGLCLSWVLANLAPGEVLRQLGRGDASLEDLGRVVAAVDSVDALYRETPLVGSELLGRFAPYYDDVWLEHGSRDEHWQSVAPTLRYDAIHAPSLNIGGWFDVFLGGTLRAFACVKQDGATPKARSPRLIVGPWAHGNMSGDFPSKSFGFMSHYQATDPTGTHLRWFDQHLRDQPADPDEAPVRIFVMGVDEWRDEADWPPPDTTYVPFYLESPAGAAGNRSGRLSTTPPTVDEGADTFSYDPKDPVPTVGGPTFLPGLLVGANAGPHDQASLDDRQDVLTYQSDPLVSDTEVVGPVLLILHVSSSAVDTDVTGKLIDVHPDGTAVILTDGILRLRYRESTSAPRLLDPDEVYEVIVDLVATANVFRRGHRIRVDISSSNFPRFDRNTNTGGRIAHESIDDSVVAVNTIHRNAARPSHLLMPIRQRD